MGEEMMLEGNDSDNSEHLIDEKESMEARPATSKSKNFNLALGK